MRNDEALDVMALACVLEPGQGQWALAVEVEGAGAVWQRLLAEDTPVGERARRLDVSVVARETAARGFRFVHRGSDEWLSGLDDLDGARGVADIHGGSPVGLWLAGRLRLDELGASGVAIVGARAATEYGVTAASELAAGLAEAGTVVISGGAYGIDAAAHRGALAVDGATVAVMACGLDGLYPSGNDALLRRIRSEHLVVSEYPPGSRPARHRFLTRNRLIAALSSATVIVEAASRSGAKNTVAWAQALGRPVLAIPGPVTSALSVTPHRLIRDAEAALVTSAADVLAELGPLGVLQPPLVDPHGRPTDDLDPAELAVREAFPARRPLSVDELALLAGVAIGECLGVLSSLSARGQVEPLGDGRWRLAKAPT